VTLSWALYGEAAKTAVGFFWKAGWAFVLGYTVSAVIQAFVPKARLTPHLGGPGWRSVSLATLFGAASSSCSFAALATARALVLKGAHFVAAVAFMFASTNLVVELGVLIVIFLGWQFLVAELLGGLLLIVFSSTMIRATYPEDWVREAREKLVEGEGEEDFDWRKRIRSREGWRLVGHKFVMDWQMVWEEIVIGFTVAGFMAVFVPPPIWARIFLTESTGLPTWVRVLENAAVAPFVAALTFIGSMGNIPLATVLDTNSVLFAGVMGFIYSDLMVPPLVRLNARYYGWRLALYIAAVMYVSIVATALVLHGGFLWLGITPETAKVATHVTQFALDYTSWLNLAFAGASVWLIVLHRQHLRSRDMAGKREAGLGAKRWVVYACLAAVTGGLVVRLLVGPPP